MLGHLRPAGAATQGIHSIMAAKEDRKRLEQVHQTDLNEGRVNEDFVEWLKTKGPTWALIILAFIVAYLWMNRWQQQEQRERNEAWADLVTTVQPASLEDVAIRHAGIDAVSAIARLTAADTLLRDIQLGRTIADDGQTIVPLEGDARAAHLTQAGRLYEAVLAEDDGTRGKTVVVIAALNGLAAVAECRGDVEQAASRYRQVASRAQDWMPALAQQAATRAESTSELAEEVQFAQAPPPPTIPTGPPSPPPGLAVPPLGSTPPPPGLAVPPLGSAPPADPAPDAASETPAEPPADHPQ